MKLALFKTIPMVALLVVVGCDEVSATIDEIDASNLEDVVDQVEDARIPDVLDAQDDPGVSDVAKDVDSADDASNDATETDAEQEKLPLVLGFEPYTGQYFNLDRGQFIIFKQTPWASLGCEDLDLRQFPMALMMSAEMSILELSEVFLIPGLDEEPSQTLIVVGLAWVSFDLEKTIRACGCAEVTVRATETAEVFIELKDVLPGLQGTYELESGFDLVSGLPSEINELVEPVVALFCDPAGRALLLACEPNLGASGLEAFCGHIFANPANPSLDSLSVVGEVALNIMNVHVMAMLQANCTNSKDPDSCVEEVRARGTILAFQRLRLLSTVRCTGEPDAVTRATTCSETWHTLDVDWVLGRRQSSLNAIPGMDAGLSGDIEVSLGDSNRIDIGRHAINLRFGSLLGFITEKILLPQMFGGGTDGLPAVASFEALFGSMTGGKGCLNGWICCEAFSDNLIAQTGPIEGLTANLVTGACEALVQTGSEYLRGHLGRLDSELQEFSIGTPLDQPCQIIDWDDDMRFDYWGSKISACLWDAEFRFQGTSFRPTNWFRGVRQ